MEIRFGEIHYVHNALLLKLIYQKLCKKYANDQLYGS